MRYVKSKIQHTVAVTVLASAVAIAGCDTDDVLQSTAQIRVIHASPDAPIVNVKLDGVTAIADLDYAESSGYQRVATGSTDIIVEAIIPGGNLDVINVPDFLLEVDSRYTVLAVDDAVNIEALVANESSATPAADEVAVAVVHASPAAGTVDVYVTAPGVNTSSVDPNFSLDYKGQIDVGVLPAGSYQIQITGAGTTGVVYDSGVIDLSPFGGQKLMLIAISTTNDIKQRTSPVKLLAATDGSELVILDVKTNAGARVVHASPDAGTAAGGPVEVFATSTALTTSPLELIPSITYTEIVPGSDSFAGVPAGDYVFNVAPDGAGIGSSVYVSPSLTLDQGSEYSVIAAGYVLTTPTFGLLVTKDNNRSVATQASVKVVHAAPAAGAVDVFVTAAGQFTVSDVENGLAGAPLLDEFGFAEITDYVAVAPDNYDIRVVAAGSVAINIENFNLAAGSVSTVIAREPIDSGAPDDFGVILLTN